MSCGCEYTLYIEGLVDLAGRDERQEHGDSIFQMAVLFIYMRSTVLLVTEAEN